MFEQGGQGPDDVADVTEAPGLGAVAVDGDRFVAQGLGHEAGDDHAVGAGLTGPHGVEEPDDDGGETLLLPVGVGQDLVDRLGLGVGPAALQGGAQDPVVVLSSRSDRFFP